MEKHRPPLPQTIRKKTPAAVIAVMAGARETSSVAASVAAARADLHAVTAGLSTNPAARAVTSTVVPAHPAAATDVMIVAEEVAVAIARIAEIVRMVAVAVMTAVAAVDTETARALSSHRLRWWGSTCRWNPRPRPRKPWLR